MTPPVTFWGLLEALRCCFIHGKPHGLVKAVPEFMVCLVSPLERDTVEIVVDDLEADVLPCFRAVKAPKDDWLIRPLSGPKVELLNTSSAGAVDVFVGLGDAEQVLLVVPDQDLMLRRYPLHDHPFENILRLKDDEPATCVFAVDLGSQAREDAFGAVKGMQGIRQIFVEVADRMLHKS